VFTLMLPARSLPSDATAPESDAIGTTQQAGL
jgi:two-component system sensor histidine kinase SenX3